MSRSVNAANFAREPRFARWKEIVASSPLANPDGFAPAMPTTPRLFGFAACAPAFAPGFTLDARNAVESYRTSRWKLPAFCAVVARQMRTSNASRAEFNGYSRKIVVCFAPPATSHGFAAGAAARRSMEEM